MSTQTPSASTPSSRPPIVAVLGHVDHGKTTLLDTIRKSSVAAKESGGITQHIGAYQVEIVDDGVKKPITFIDTPGHEAFAKMRSRGSHIADIAILVVAATEGVKPQTEESINHIKKAGIPMIVAMNKMDLPEANVDKVKQQLAKVGVLVENFGGDVVVIPVSAKAGTGVDKLLETIVLVAEMKGLTADPKAPFSGVVIESKMDKHRGPLSTIIVTTGTLNVGDTIYSDSTEAKVRALITSEGAQVKSAPPSFPVEIMGWKQIPTVGTVVSIQKQIQVAEEQRFEAREFKLPPLETIKKLKVILKADVAGTLEAIHEALGDMVEWVATGAGEINESDIHLAKSTNSVIIGFNLKPNAKLIDLAKTEKVRLKVYSIIYELLDEIAEVTQLLNKPEATQKIMGEALIQAEFESGDTRIAGCKVEKGRLTRGDFLKLMRGEKEITRAKIKSIRHGKADVPKAEAPSECGVVFDKKLDFVIGDRIIAFTQLELLA